jgi:hypothetical protein
MTDYNEGVIHIPDDDVDATGAIKTFPSKSF